MDMLPTGMIPTELTCLVETTVQSNFLLPNHFYELHAVQGKAFIYTRNISVAICNDEQACNNILRKLHWYILGIKV